MHNEGDDQPKLSLGMVGKGVSMFRLLLNSHWKPRCSFCGYEREDPAMVMGGPSQVYICIECADWCRKVFHEKGLIDAGEPWHFAGRRFRDQSGKVTGGIFPDTPRVVALPLRTVFLHRFAADGTRISAKEPSWLRRHLSRTGPWIDNEGLLHMIRSLVSENRDLRRRVQELEEAKG
jgi:hypothetical protein